MSKVIIIAERSRAARALRITLELASHEVVETHHGSVAALLVPALKPELVLVDAALTGLPNATHLCHVLKTRSPALRVLLVGGTVAQAAHTSGADGWLPLPFEPWQLLETVQQQLDDEAACAGAV